MATRDDARFDEPWKALIQAKLRGVEVTGRRFAAGGGLQPTPRKPSIVLRAGLDVIRLQVAIQVRVRLPILVEYEKRGIIWVLRKIVVDAPCLQTGGCQQPEQFRTDQWGILRKGAKGGNNV